MYDGIPTLLIIRICFSSISCSVHDDADDDGAQPIPHNAHTNSHRVHVVIDINSITTDSTSCMRREHKHHIIHSTVQYSTPYVFVLCFGHK